MPNNMSVQQRRLYEIFLFGVRFLGVYAMMPLIFNRFFVDNTAFLDYRNDIPDTLASTTLRVLAQLSHTIGPNTLATMSSCAFLVQFPGAVQQCMRAGTSLTPDPIPHPRTAPRRLTIDIEAPASPIAKPQLTPRYTANTIKFS